MYHCFLQHIVCRAVHCRTEEYLGWLSYIAGVYTEFLCLIYASREIKLLHNNRHLAVLGSYYAVFKSMKFDISSEIGKEESIFINLTGKRLYTWRGKRGHAKHCGRTFKPST
jgi:hypothetical protein